MLEQAKTLAPSRYQHILRDGTIGETDHMIKQRKKLTYGQVVTCNELVSSKGLKVSLSIKLEFSLILLHSKCWLRETIIV